MARSENGSGHERRIKSGDKHLREYDINARWSSKNLRITPLQSDVGCVTSCWKSARGPDCEGQSIGVLTPGPHEFGNPAISGYADRQFAARRRQQSHDDFHHVRRCFYVDE